ncbi:MAG TPA: branched-chain amino acid ABC transporter permease [Candidatus Limnocylindrales bacterium]|jgi:ABC-type branched-subunit amino acid transport system permease subunit
MSATIAARTSPAGPPSPRARIEDLATRHRSSAIVVGMLIIAVGLIVLPKIPPLSLIDREDPWYDTFANAGVYILLAMGLNVVVGLAGLLDLGYAAFFAIGSYTYAYSNSPFAGTDFPFLPMLLVGASVAAVFGIALGAPTLRLRGDYLAIMTLGFGEIVPIVFLNLDTWTLGTNGIGGIYRPDPLPLIGEFTPLTPFAYFILMVGIVTVAMILLYRMQDSRIGRAWNAIREDELAAAANGINTVTTKLLAFAIGATTAGLAGVFNASKLTIVSPEQFGFAVSFIVLAMVILGGMGNIWGVAVGAFIVYEIQVQGFKQLNKVVEGLAIPVLKDVNFTDYQYLLFGGALVLMMLFRPEGLFPSQRRRRELHIAEELAGPADDEIDVAAGAAMAGSLGATPGSGEDQPG